MSTRKAGRGECVAWLQANASYAGNDCLAWPFLSKSSTGYGSVLWDGRMTSANRAMCLLAHGEPPSPNMEAAHSCGNRLCCNPRHLRWATRKENRADKVAHGTVNNGTRNGAAKLTEANVLEIRRMVARGAFHRVAAARFGVSRESVSEIVRREKWTHI